MVLHIALDREILGILGSGQLRHKELLILIGDFLIFRRQLLGGQALVNGAETAVHSVDNVPGGVLDGVPGVAALGSHVVIYALDSGAIFAAALLVCHLHLEKLLHQGSLLIAPGKLRRLETVADILVHACKPIEHTGIHGIEAVANTVVYTVNFPLDVGKIGRENIPVHHASAGTTTAEASTPAVAAPAEEAEDQENDDPCRPITAPASAIAAVVAIGDSSDISGGHFTCCNTHFVLLSKDEKYNKIWPDYCLPSRRSEAKHAPKLLKLPLHLLCHLLGLVKLLLVYAPALYKLIKQLLGVLPPHLLHKLGKMGNHLHRIRHHCVLPPLSWHRVFPLSAGSAVPLQRKAAAQILR